MSSREQRWTANGETFNVRLQEVNTGGELDVNGDRTTFHVVERSTNSLVVEIDGEVHRLFFVHDSKACTVWWRGRTYRLVRATPEGSGHATAHTGTGDVHAPMPGKILRLDVQEGSDVAAKQPLLVMESMKMETVIPSPKAGRVTQILVKTGEVVEMNAVLMKIE